MKINYCRYDHNGTPLQWGDTEAAALNAMAAAGNLVVALDEIPPDFPTLWRINPATRVLERRADLLVENP